MINDSRIAEISGFGSVTDVPRLPAGLADRFSSYRVDTGKVRLHAVIGGSGAPLLLHGGWPQCWYQWRFMMMPLSEHFTVVAVDPRGFGLSDKPLDGYDADSIANDMFDLMDVLGHERFSVLGHDIGMRTAYIMAAARPERIGRIAVGEAVIHGALPPALLVPDNGRMAEKVWHMNFNRLESINERLVEGREHLFFDYQFRTKAGTEDGIPPYARDFYVDMIRCLPGALKAGFAYYRAADESIVQLRKYIDSKISLPVFTFAGELSVGSAVEQTFRNLATDVTALVIPDCGHYPPEEAPDALLPPLLEFLCG